MLDIEKRPITHWDVRNARKSNTPRKLRRNASSAIGRNFAVHRFYARSFHFRVRRLWILLVKNLDALQKVQPVGWIATIGTHQVFRYSVVTPAHAFEAVVAELGDRVVELTARDSFDERLAAFLLE